MGEASGVGFSIGLMEKTTSRKLARDGDTFTFALTSENAPAGTISKAIFSGSPGARLNLEYFDSDKLRTFTP